MIRIGNKAVLAFLDYVVGLGRSMAARDATIHELHLGSEADKITIARLTQQVIAGQTAYDCLLVRYDHLEAMLRNKDDDQVWGSSAQQYNDQMKCEEKGKS